MSKAWLKAMRLREAFEPMMSNGDRAQRRRDTADFLRGLKEFREKSKQVGFKVQ